MPITSQISLSQGVPRLEFRTEVNNPARDHRLRVHFPTSLHTDSSDAEGAFDVVRRPLGLPDGTDDWVEQPVPTQPQKAFVDVSDGQSGLMLANRGLPEYEVLREDDGSATVALTLLRCVGWLSRDDFRCRKGHAGPALETPEAQCPGRHVFEYALVPHAGGWQAVYGQAHAFAAPLRAVVPSSQLGSLPLVQSLIQLEGDGLVLSAVKVAEAQDGLIVRFYNITDRASTACLRTFVQARSASVVNLAEQKLRPLDVDRTGQVRVEVQGKQIFTVKLLF
jgi:alpha-mannosidase